MPTPKVASSGSGAPRQPARPPAGRAPLDHQFWGSRSLSALRSVVNTHGAALGLTGERLQALVMIMHELAANAVRHAGGSGRLRMWRAGGSVYGEIADRGPGMADPDKCGAHHPPPAGQEGGRGLFSVRRLADTLNFYDSGSGMVITASVAVDRPARP